MRKRILYTLIVCAIAIVGVGCSKENESEQVVIEAPAVTEAPVEEAAPDKQTSEESQSDVTAVSEDTQYFDTVELVTSLYSNGSKGCRITIDEDNSIVLSSSDGLTYSAALFFDESNLTMEIICINTFIQQLGESVTMLVISSGEDTATYASINGQTSAVGELSLDKYYEVTEGSSPTEVLEIVAAVLQAIEAGISYVIG